MVQTLKKALSIQKAEGENDKNMKSNENQDLVDINISVSVREFDLQDVDKSELLL